MFDFDVAIGVTLIAEGHWCIVDEITDGCVWVIDRDGDCFELLPGMVEHVYSDE